MPGTMSSKSPKKSNRQAEADASKRRNIIIASVVAVAVVAVAVVLIASGGSSDSGKSSGPKGVVTGQKETKDLLNGIPQKGASLGNAKAPVTVIEFVDLQCPFCKEWSTGPLPVIINDYVRPGKVRFETRTLTFIGPDSQKAAIAGAAAGQQNKEWNYQQLFYFNQGQENSGYVTDAFIEKIYRAAGVNVSTANAAREKPSTKAPQALAQKGAEQYGIVSTPTFVMGKTGGPYQKVDIDISSPDSMKAALDALLK